MRVQTPGISWKINSYHYVEVGSLYLTQSHYSSVIYEQFLIIYEAFYVTVAILYTAIQKFGVDKNFLFWKEKCLL